MEKLKIKKFMPSIKQYRDMVQKEVTYFGKHNNSRFTVSSRLIPRKGTWINQWSKFMIDRVRTGYGILKRKFHMEKLWNLSKTAVPMKKLWNLRFGGKKKCVLFKNNGGKIRRDFEMWFQCLLVQLSLHHA